ncbi:glycosyltransferase family 1 protein [Sphingomonas gilva]|uniref:Glycosyltransferase family 1 protein n=1 Tax=Sphingomonas gilva TaxID=2305907 RepID=A0A396RKC6_9SPHN|nr:glycosyltransferase family 4 protein [Sphingomonas gilva]RHW16707.1 glycosyltransferase family 1 protein [Sphingomonas gilva]
MSLVPQPVVAICINSAWNVANFRAGVVRALVAAGYRVVAMAPPDHPAAALREIGCELVPVPMERGSLSPIHDIRLLVKFRRVLKALRPVAVLGYTIKPNVYGGLAAQSLGIPVINNIAGLGTMFLRGRMAAAVAGTLYKLALARSHTIFFQNPDDLEMFVARRLVSPTKAALLPGSGIDLDRFRVAPLPAQDGAAPVFLLVARLLRDKGVVEFADAARMLRQSGVQARFVVVGDHDPENAASIPLEMLRAWMAEGVVEYRGPVADVREAIAEADIVVLPSYREGLPRTLLEGAAMGRPLVATDVPGCREVVDDGVNGFLCRARDAIALRDALMEMLSAGAGGRSRMASASRERVERLFDERFVVEAYMRAVAKASALKS